MSTEPAPIPQPDLADCEREPIHIPGSVQPHGFLLVLREPGLDVLQASANVRERCGVDPAALAGRGVESVVPALPADALRRFAAREQLDQNPMHLSTVRVGPAGDPFHAVAHRSDGTLILEFEPAGRPPDDSVPPQPHALIRSSVARLQGAQTAEELCRAAAEEVRRLTGFDRVMTYRFDEQYNGEVVAEDRAAELPPFLGHHFPASDIPAQARRLYLLNRVRLIADVDYRPAPLVPTLNPDTNRPVDLSFAGLRSVSPIHVEYLKNMGVGASMSISVVVDGRLWGLMACHHRTPRYVPPDVRVGCDFVGQFFSAHLTSLARRDEAEQHVRLKSMLAELLAGVAAAPDVARGLAGHGTMLMRYANATGAALYLNGEVIRVGDCPPEPDLRALAEWLFDRGEDVFASASLPLLYPPAAAFKDRASGVLAVSMSRVNRNLLIWLRPEVVRTVNWSGDPHKPATVGGDRRLHPRRSFEVWKEIVRDHSLRWSDVEVEAAADLRNAIVGIVLKQAEELGNLSTQLQLSNRELEAFSYSVSHDLRAPFRHIVGFSDLLVKRAASMDETSRRYVNTIAASARYAGELVDGLLAFSQMSRAEVRRERVDLDALARTVLNELRAGIGDRRVEWRVDPLPALRGDQGMLRLVLRNLLENALKYTRGRDVAHVHFGVQPVPADGPDAGRHVFFVRDDGVGFDMSYVGKLFGVFQRLHRTEEFEGTGIGLANVKRIIERHGGRVWAESEVGKGATFWFTLPAAD
jgi:chemotaxis family two-component system sensor kinase Cph1